jgi:DNA-binding NarL/FixJ family response regulator
MGMRSKEGSVVLADGDKNERAAVAEILRRAGYETVQVGTGSDALDAARSEDVGALLLEVALPDMTGYEVCHELRQEGVGLPILFVSGTRTDPIDRVAGLLLGADDYITRPFDGSELVARIGRHVSRKRPAPAAPTLEAAVELTTREQEVLDLLAVGRAQKEIAYDLSISPKTVGSHIQKLLMKTGVHSRAELVARAYRSGLVSPLHDRRGKGRTAVAAVGAVQD